MKRAFSSKAYWACQLLGWGLYALINALLFASQQQSSVGQWLPSVISMGALGLGASHLHRSFIARSEWASLGLSRLAPRVVAASLGLAAVVQSAQMLLLLFVFHSFTVEQTSVVVFIVYVVQSAILMLLWQVVYFGTHAVQRARWAEVDRLSSLAAAQTAELRALRSQVNPHFLFNSLNTVRALIVEDPAKAQEAVTRLSTLLRYALASGERQTVPLSQELEMVGDYLALEGLRFEERLRVVIDVQPACLTEPVPMMSVQTLVENAVKHGIARSAVGGEIRVTARIELGVLSIEVVNPTPTAQAPDVEQSTGVGLVNTQERLRLLFGEKASFALKTIGLTTVAEVKIPCR